MRKLKLEDGSEQIIKDMEINELLGITQPTMTRKRKEKSFSYKQLEKIANHYKTNLENVYSFLGY